MNAPEDFLVYEAAVGMAVPIRQCTAEQLARHLKIVQGLHTQYAKDIAKKTRDRELLQMVDDYCGVGQVCSALAFEMDRRARSLLIVPK